MFAIKNMFNYHVQLLKERSKLRETARRNIRIKSYFFIILSLESVEKTRLLGNILLEMGEDDDPQEKGDNNSRYNCTGYQMSDVVG
jgi:hypothetical protein